MIKLYLTPGTRAGRVAWLLEELEIEYELEVLPFTKEGLKSSEHRSRHALGSCLLYTSPSPRDS